ncbi:hypothetical protein [Caulobacter vibrioides]|uniref:Uncharacterized protein n=2 Tax=Caulobacter vibrioides TaxID=155892 RepID=Q9A2L3_CAUVC|nr:hypothetical protein [Caulobacter vibrioides]YP_002519035.1 hypothetical protein CCNA_03662 [Caulobacter vibrioides NA1000]AAK25510.1 hypothetical protein CC_3548 [Caulobacter vibrioides CB15]ACL97127.1 hypothetical protein CCNA_03662 [Caulobacter vibrioides NA1000]ATC30359.1 hypothetical protein CA607_19055 [Caulobacter vibrioides]QXZ51887.1 hypothetical protein KZH45_18785 [Caulobacter vibrioides]
MSSRPQRAARSAGTQGVTKRGALATPGSRVGCAARDDTSLWGLARLNARNWRNRRQRNQPLLTFTRQLIPGLKTRPILIAIPVAGEGVWIRPNGLLADRSLARSHGGGARLSGAAWSRSGFDRGLFVG